VVEVQRSEVGPPLLSVKEARQLATRVLFGAPLQPMGRGYYVTLEFLAIARGALDLQHRSGGLANLFDPGADKVSHLRNPSDFARRLIRDPSASFLRDPKKPHPKKEIESELPEPEVLETISSLLAGLSVPVPFITKNDWYKTHFFPYEGDLIHYDAVVRSGRPKLERDAYRGGGLLVFDLLRTDPVVARRLANGSLVVELVRDSMAPVGRTLRSLSKFDELEPASLTEQFELDFHQEREQSPYADVLRSGVATILKLDVSRARRVQYLMQWVPFVVALHQRELSYRELRPRSTDVPRVSPPILVAMEESSMLRAVSRDELGETRRVIERSLATVVDRLVVDELIDESIRDELKGDSSDWKAEPGSFFALTMAAVGALNSNTGRRHFVLRPSLLEAVVAATVGDTECTFSEFTDGILEEQLGLLVSRRSCESAELNQPVDGGRAERNERHLERLMTDCGLVDELSDTSSVVRLPLERSQ